MINQILLINSNKYIVKLVIAVNIKVAKLKCNFYNKLSKIIVTTDWKRDEYDWFNLFNML